MSARPLGLAMSRHPLVPLAVLALVTLGGCLQVAGLPETADLGGPAAGGPAGPSSPGPDGAPEHPGTLTADTAAAYVEAYEEHHREVTVLREAEVDVTDVSVDCTATDVVATGDGYEVTVDCGFSYEFEDGDTVGIADGVPYQATYVVDESSIGRVGEERRTS